MQYRNEGADTKRREQIEQASNRMSILLCLELYGIHVDAKGLEECGMEQALAYVCCPETDSRVRLQKHCRKIYELGYVPICPRFGFLPFLDEASAEDMQGMSKMSQILLRRCRMVVVCGSDVTESMHAEIGMADRLHIICTTLEGLIRIKESG